MPSSHGEDGGLTLSASRRRRGWAAVIFGILIAVNAIFIVSGWARWFLVAAAVIEAGAAIRFFRLAGPQEQGSA